MNDYDEYRFNLDEISHDPYVLTSLLTAYHQGEWTRSEVQAALQTFFDRQYTLTQTVNVEVHYRPETRHDSNGDPYTVQVPYNYYICNVKLENADLSHLPVEFLNEDQLHQYATYMATPPAETAPVETPPTETPPAETEPETSAQPLTPDGNMELVDDIEGKAGEDKQFIVVQSRRGQYHL